MRGRVVAQVLRVTALLVVVSLPAGVGATTIRVPGDQPTIQQGLSAANSGDTVRVASGVYNETIFWPFENGIVLIGSGAESTVVRGNASDPVIFLVYVVDIDTSTVIRGFRFVNGGDAGIALSGASPLVELCAVDSTLKGPGINCGDGSAAVIRNCQITGSNGSGIKLQNCGSAMVIAWNTISGNTASEGGGIYCYSSSSAISNNTISGNSAYNAGGGIYCYYFSSPAISDNTISGNSSYNIGGGICCDLYSSPAISSNTISGNSASYAGGGIYCYYHPSPAISNNTITENTANNGGGIFCHYSSYPIISGNTLTRNSANVNGGALYCDSQSDLQFSSNTVTENTAYGSGDGVYTVSSKPTLSYCNIAYNGFGLYNSNLSPTPSARYNWWGHASGPWHPGNPGGQGDSLSSYAWDFTPWLTEADTLAPPMPPMGLAAEGFSGCSIQLSWQAVPVADIVGYKVYLGRDTTRYSYTDTFDIGNGTQCIVGELACDSTYRFAITCYDRLGDESWYSREVTATPVVAVPDLAAVPTALRLEGNYPNPFNPQTNIAYSTPREGRVELDIYDVSGRRIAALVDGVQGPGRHFVLWNGRSGNGEEMASGVYFVRLQFAREVQSRKIVLVR
jgi:parallel beta-helix repeat protein/predicted outer membrane repeat protein